ncbi:MAG: PA2169 family four-helix-bundle protein [Bacteroidota bacterium]|nr:PA2169 family four-helix-bundle protein [Bacteroidota bacterium]
MEQKESITARNKDLVEVLNDLIRINHDRITGYEKAADEAKDFDFDLKGIFHRMAEESSLYAAELTQEVVRLGGEPAGGTTNSGKIYRVWMDLKATFTGHGREAILASCEFGEDAAQTAYKTALAEDDLTPELRQLITNQKSALRTSHDLIKRYRDMHESIRK